MRDVLVVYGSRNGSTREAAETFAATLRGDGREVTLAEAERMRDPVTGYRLVVVGGSLYNGRWHTGAHHFLRRHRRELAEIPVAVFALGPRRDLPEAWARSRSQLDGALRRRSWLRPVAVTVFGGVDPPKRERHADLRDPALIEGWARSVVEHLKPGPTDGPLAG